MFLNIFTSPWPWYVAGPLIGLMVPVLLIIGNKSFGISSSLRHACAICFPANISYFQYDWKKELWNLFFVSGVLIGGILCAHYFADTAPVTLNPKLVVSLSSYGITDYNNMVPKDLFNWHSLITIRGF